MSLTSAIATHVANFPAEALPSSTSHATVRALLDAYGVMLAARGLSDEVRPFRGSVVGGSGTTGSRLIGETVMAAPAEAALVNGALAHALDFGDTFDAGPAHPNAALVPALLALADNEPWINGERLVAAMALGSDIACRLSLACEDALDRRGYYPPPVYALVGAAIGCAYLLGLDAVATADTIGIAICGASFPAEIKYDARSHLRAVRDGFAAAAAVRAALLARAGLHGFMAPLEGDGGLFMVYAGGEVDPAPLLDGLGRNFRGEEVSFKPWPSCRGTHAYIEAAQIIRRYEGFDVHEIQEIVAITGPVQQMLIEPRDRKIAPVTAIDAKFSIPFTTAVGLLEGVVTLDSFTEAARNDPKLRMLAAMVRAEPQPGWGRDKAAAGGLRVRLRNGTLFEAQIDQARGHPSRPMDDRELVDKFVCCAMRSSPATDRAAAERKAEVILNAARLESAARLLD